MPFDVKSFMSTKFLVREAGVLVPDLKMFFAKGDKPEWKVRGLTGMELGKCNEAAEKNRNIVAAAIKAMFSPTEEEKVEGFREFFGTGDKMPQHLALKVELFVLGSTKPTADLELALRLCKYFPVEFIQITDEITKLTGMGHIPGKAKPSGKTKPSGQH